MSPEPGILRVLTHVLPILVLSVLEKKTVAPVVKLGTESGIKLSGTENAIHWKMAEKFRLTSFAEVIHTV